MKRLYEEIGVVNTRDMFKRAMDGGYAVPAYNFNNMEQLQAVIIGCAESKSPVILQVSKGAREYANQTLLRYMAMGAVKTSVMIDGSHLPYEDNIKLTKQVVDFARQSDVSVEGELGVLAGIEEHVVAEKSNYTDPAQVQDFVGRTGVDSLAISIGTSHGAYKFKLKPGETVPPLRFDILKEIEKKLPGFPIVLHGASSVLQKYVAMINEYGGKLEGAAGVPEEQLREAARSAVCKVNIDTDGRMVVTAIIRKVLTDNPKEFDPRKYLGPARKELIELIKHKNASVLGSAGRY